jgi:hypothetical protein
MMVGRNRLKHVEHFIEKKIEKRSILLVALWKYDAIVDRF